MVTIIYVHPWEGSFCHAIFDTIKSSLQQQNREFQLIDLYADNFNPVFTGKELALYAKGKYIDPLVGKYQEMLKSTDELIIIYPMWWFSEPAIFKGFMDKVMLKDFAFSDGKVVMTGLLKNIKKTFMITTSNSPNWFVKIFNAYPKRVFARFVLRGIGITNVKWFNMGQVKKSADSRKKFLEKISSTI